MRRVLTTLVLLATTHAAAVDVHLRAETKEVEQAILVALKSLETADITYTLKTDSGPLFRLGSGVPFNPDVASRTLTVNGATIIEINPNGPIPIADVYRQEVAQAIGLPRDAKPQDVKASFGGADLNADGKVDLTDLAILAKNFGRSGTGIPGDLNRDGKVNDADVELFRKEYALP